MSWSRSTSPLSSLSNSLLSLSCEGRDMSPGSLVGSAVDVGPVALVTGNGCLVTVSPTWAGIELDRVLSWADFDSLLPELRQKKKRGKPKFPLILGQTLNFPRKTPVSILFLLILFRRANDSNAVSTWPVLLSKLFSLTRNRFKERHSKHLTELVPTIRGKTGFVTNNKDFVLS